MSYNCLVLLIYAPRCFLLIHFVSIVPPYSCCSQLPLGRKKGSL
jgi:hypothetical protein